MSSDADVTLILEDWARGDRTALDRLLPHVYPELHQLASAHLRHAGRSVTLQTTAVVNDLFLKLLARRPGKLENRRHFYVLASRIIRRALVDHYRRNSAEKRAGGTRVPLHENLLWVDAAGPQMLTFDRALGELEELDPEQAELFSLRYLLGCTAEETAALAGLAKSTVDRKVKLARAWLFRRMGESESVESANVSS